MFGERSIPLFHVFGIRIGANPSWFLFLFLMIYWLSGYFAKILVGYSSNVSFAVAVTATVLFFASLLLHELGHALAARRQGIATVGIDLWLLGGVAKLSRDSNTPGEEFKVAAAGPAVTALIVALCFGLAALTSQDASLINVTTGKVIASSPLIALIGWLGIVNVALLLFNLVPAFPLDGGRIARAVAWKVTGSKGQGTRLASYLGQLFGSVLIMLGILALVRGDLISGLWLVILGWFLLSAARSAIISSRFMEQLEGITAGDLMDAEPISIPSSATVIEANQQFFSRYHWPWFAVVDQLGHLEGILTAEKVNQQLATDLGQEMTISELVDPLLDNDAAVSPQMPLEILLSTEAIRLFGAVLVTDNDNRLLGIITLQRVQQALTAAQTKT